MHTFFFSKIEATPKIEGVITMAKAHVGDIIEFKDTLQESLKNSTKTPLLST